MNMFPYMCNGFYSSCMRTSYQIVYSAQSKLLYRILGNVPRPRPDCRPGIFYCEFFEIGQESFTRSCSLFDSRSIRPSTANNWTAWKAALIQKRPFLINIGRIVFQRDKARSHTSLVSSEVRMGRPNAPTL